MAPRRISDSSGRRSSSPGHPPLAPPPSPGRGQRPNAEVLRRADIDSVAAMIGRPDLRLGISDVAPIVSCGAFSARAVVGEHIPVTATVFREGHDAVAANVAFWGPGDTAAPPLQRLVRYGEEPDRWLATVVPDREG